MKTVFISCFTGLISRNILSTDAFSILAKRGDLKIVIITPESRTGALQKEFGVPNVIVEGVSIPPLQGLDRLLWAVATNLLNSETRHVQRLAKFAHDANRADYFVSQFVALLGRIRALRRVFRVMVRMLFSTREVEQLFLRYRPALLFAADVYTPLDLRLMLHARMARVKTVGMVRSWDNVTSKTLLMHIPERLVVNTERIRAEAIRYGDVPKEQISVVGVPHYDHYGGETRTPREVFFKKFGLDPGKKTILFTPPSDHYLKHDPITPLVLRTLEPLGVQVLVRMPLVGKADLGDYERPSNVAFDEPETSPDFTEVHLSREADRHLADSIYHSDLVITWASTMIVDAAVFGKPIILVGFNASLRPYGESIIRYYDYNHQKHILEVGGVKLARAPEELLAAVERYLADPRADEVERKQIVAEHCGVLDGKAGERLAAILLGEL